MRRVRLANLDVVLSGGPDREGGGTGPMLVLMHGYGAPGEDLVPLARQIRLDPSVRLAFPAAPLELDMMPGARAWWQLDMVELQRAVMNNDLEALKSRVPEGLSEARAAIDGLLDALEQEHAVRRDELVLGGFSQGAMLATDVALRAERPPAALAILSGSLIAQAEWLPLMKARAPMPVLQSHGRSDPVLSFQLAEALRQELTAAGVSVEFIAFNGGHGIPDGAVDALAKLMGRVTA